MVAERLGRLAARVVSALEPATAKVKATEFAQKLKTEYERGLAEASASGVATPGDDATAGEAPAASGDGSAAGEPGAAGPASSAAPSDDVSAVAAALRSVDWGKVRAATAEHTSGARQRMASMAADVDWGKVKSGAAVVSSALIAAVAAGQIPVGGRLAGPIAKAILNDADLASKVSAAMGRDGQPPDLTTDVKP